MCTEHHGDWSLHKQHFSGNNDFSGSDSKIIENSLFEVLMMIFS